ncbi:MAG: Tn3 family transposase, partial [Burkholderiales bacterium]|nr:Tn3 family transposase [Burkholderiales bacterium]
HEFYLQRTAIMKYFEYHNWNSQKHKLILATELESIVKRDTATTFILTETLSFLRFKKIIRPGYTTLQDLISEALNKERQRLGKLLSAKVSTEMQKQLNVLLSTDNMISELAALKQDAKDFKYRIMQAECGKLETLRPLYRLAKSILPSLSISQQNINLYAGLAHFYTVYELREFKPEQRNLYLLCYSWQRYQKITDNLVDAFCYHIKHFDDSIKSSLNNHKLSTYKKQKKHAKKVAKLLGLFTDDAFDDKDPYGKVRKKAYKILPKEQIEALVAEYTQLNKSEQEQRWKIFDKNGYRFRKNLRPLFLQLNLSSNDKDDPYIQVIELLKQRFNNQQTIPVKEQKILNIIPERSESYLLNNSSGGNVAVNADRFEYWLYQQCREKLLAGELYLEDSASHRSFDAELLSPEAELEALSKLNLPIFHNSCDKTLDKLTTELEDLWYIFNKKLKKAEFKHLEYDKDNQEILVKKPPEDSTEEIQEQFYNQVSPSNIINVFQFVNEKCKFLKALTPLQSRYAKKIPNDNELFAVIMAQAMNHGLNVMADISNISYHTLQYNYKQYFRESTLRKANSIISAAISKLPIFRYYQAGFDMRFAAVDGQKFSVKTPTTKARYSKKYFGRGRGVVAYTLLCNHIPLHSKVISAHNHESHYVFDMIYNNESTIYPEVITGDMHSINKANFATLYWFDIQFNPRFTNLAAEIKKVSCTKDNGAYANFLIKPTDKIDIELIKSEWSNIRRIMVTLAQKETTQHLFIKKLCSYSPSNKTRKALFEFDKLVRSIYTLKYTMDQKLQRNVHRSQNRLEAYHQLRSVTAQVGGKKELTGRTDIEVEISNQCGWLLANAIIYYNSAILSKLLEIYQKDKNEACFTNLLKVSPVAWQHIYLIGKYLFEEQESGIDLVSVLSQLINQDNRMAAA